METLPDLPTAKEARTKHDLLASEIMDLEEQADRLKIRHEQFVQMLEELLRHSDTLAQQSRTLAETHERLGQAAYQAFIAGALPDQPIFADRKACRFRLARLQEDQKRLGNSSSLLQKAKGQALLAINRGELQRERSLARSLEIELGRELIETNSLDLVQCTHTEGIVTEVRRLRTQGARATQAVTQIQAKLEANNHVVPPSVELAKVLSVNRLETELAEYKMQIEARWLQLTTLRSSFPDQLLESVNAIDLPANDELNRLLHDLRAVQSVLGKKRS